MFMHGLGRSENVRKAGLPRLLGEALKSWKKRGITRVWVSLDIDYLAGGYAEAHRWTEALGGIPAIPGARAGDFYSALRQLKAGGFELAGLSVEEYDPHLDHGGTPAKSVIMGVAGLVRSLWGGHA